MTKYNKLSTLAQLQIIEDNLRRLQTLVEADMVEGYDTGVPLYCILNVRNQSTALAEELAQAFGLSEAMGELTIDQQRKLLGDG